MIKTSDDGQLRQSALALHGFQRYASLEARIMVSAEAASESATAFATPMVHSNRARILVATKAVDVPKGHEGLAAGMTTIKHSGQP